MNPDDKVRPFHAKDDAKGQEAADALAAVLQHAAERDKAAHAKAPPKKQPRWMLPVTVNLVVLAVYLLIAPPAFVTVNPIEGPDPAVQEESLRLAMYLQANRIEAYRIEHGELPTALSDAGSAPEGVEYRRQGADRYVLVASFGETALVYDSTQSPADFIGAAASRLMEG